MKSVLGGGERWTPRNFGASPIQDVLRQEFGNLLGDFLSARGFVDLEAVESFLNTKLADIPSPKVFKNLDESAKLFAKHIQENKKILVYGDYDVDGMSGLTLAADFFEK